MLALIIIPGIIIAGIIAFITWLLKKKNKNNYK